MRKHITLLLFLFSISIFCQQKKDSVQRWKVTGKLTFLLNQSSFSNWTSGGENTIAGNININYDFNYKKNNWNWDNKIITGYGLSHIDEKGLRKTNDQFEYNSLLGLKSKGYWFFSFFTNLTTQYTRGYNYSTIPKKPVSDFLSPAYLSFGPGILWKKSDDIRINIAPATSRFTFVSKEFSGKYGVPIDKKHNFSLGFNLSGYIKFDLMENVIMENNIVFYTDYLEKPQNIDMNYQMNLLLNVNKYLSMNITLHTILDDNASSKIQFREVFGLGVNYMF
ncbi:MAG: DUF3078 domain-containing protein [Polaribacter sp.]